MDEPCRDRASRNPEDREHRAGRRPRIERAVLQLGEGQKLVELDAAAGRRLACVRDLDDGGQSRLQGARRERPVGLAYDETGARILLPEDLEGRVIGGGDAEGGLGQNP
ncbi:MAG TPA: hypothetical protein VH620_07810 [Gaiella sp.]